MGRSIKIPRFLAVVGGTGILPKAALAVPGGPWVWSLGLFSSIFFLHIHKQKKKKKKKKKLIKKEVPPGGGHPLHLGWLNPAITSSVGDSTVQFLVVGTCVRARPLLTVQCHTLCIHSC